MTTLKAAGRLLASDAGNRILRYLLLPYGEPGRTSAGLVTASKGSVTIPQDVTTLVANEEHDFKQPRSKFLSVEETDQGLEATVQVLETRAGDDLLVEAAAGVKSGMSVEIENPVIRAGKLVAGLLSGAGHVVRPAFPSAMLTAADTGEETPAEDQGEDPEDPTPEEQAQDLREALAPHLDAETAALLDQVLEQALAEVSADEESNNENEEPPVAKTVTASRPAAAGRVLTASHQDAKPEPAPGEALRTLSAALVGLQGAADSGPQALHAALAPITQADAFDATTVPDYVGELYQGRQYFQRYAPLVSQGTLTSAQSIGWRFKDGKTPQVFDYAGNLAEVTSTDVEMEQVQVKAERLAGGNKIDRIYTDLPDGGAMAAYLRESQDDYLKKIDLKVLNHILANNTTTALPTLPAFYSGPIGWAKLLHGARVLLDHALPTYAIVGSDLWFEMGLTTQDQKLEYLSTQLGLEEGQAENFKLVGAPYSATNLNGKVLVGTQGGTTLEQLPGGPVRVNTIGIANGSVDHGVFGYYKLWTPDPRYVVSVTDGASPAALAK